MLRLNLLTVWEPVVGYEGQYAVSNKGKVKVLQSSQARRVGTIFRGSPNNLGYPMVKLSGKKRIMKAVHSIVTEAFLGKRPYKFVVNHKDFDKTNNRLENLEYTTYKGNYHHSYASNVAAMPRGEASYRSKLKEQQVLEIKIGLENGETSPNLARQYGVATTTIKSIKQGLNWKHVKVPIDR